MILDPSKVNLIITQIESAELPAAVYRMARRLLDIALIENGTFSLPRAQMREFAGTDADSTMRRHLIALSKAGIIEYRASENVIVAFKKWHEMITVRSPDSPCAPDDPGRSLDEHNGDHVVILEDHPVNNGKKCSSDDPGRSLDDPGRSSGAQNGVSHIGIGWLVGSPLGTDNQPTNGAESPEPPKQPEPPANSPPLEAQAVALLLDPSVGVAMPKAKHLAQGYSFLEIRRQVFGWLVEHRRGAVKVGALINRIETGWSCPAPDPDTDRTLWDRYRTHAELEAVAQAEAELAEMLDHPLPKSRPKPSRPAPTYDDPWAVTVAELGLSNPDLAALLGRAQVETIGEHNDAQVWQITLDIRDVDEYGWVHTRGAILVRKTLTSIVGHAVLVDVILPETVPAQVAA